MSHIANDYAMIIITFLYTFNHPYSKIYIYINQIFQVQEGAVHLQHLFPGSVLTFGKENRIRSGD